MKAVLAALLALTSYAHAYEVIPDDQWKTAKDVVSFQPFAQATDPIQVGNYKVTLTNLNVNINSWYLLTVTSTSGWRKTNQVFNLENPIPLSQKVELMADGKIQLIGANGDKTACDLIGADGSAGPAWDALGADPYMPLCDGKLYLRNKADGHKDAVSWATTNLRDVFGDAGDKVVNMVKEDLYDGKFFEGGTEAKEAKEATISEGGPNAAKVSESINVTNTGIGIQLADKSQGMELGQWYKSANFDGVYVSVMKAKYVDKDIMKSFTDRVRALDNSGGGESEALVDSVAIDISAYKFGWTNGTEHPGVGWSSRATNPHKDPGPDGFDTTAPLVLPGVLSPYDASRTIGVLTGGFQRHHSAFKTGPLTGINRSHHYGFMEKGVVMSTLVPNLASFIVYQDGSMDLKTWTLADNARLNTMRDVRQNGVPLIENGEPSVFVNQWGAGNWSGSADKELKTPRTSACIAEKDGRKFLIVSYFSTHTPNAMARVLQSYGCSYAIHLDMNSPRFAYTAFFTNTADGDFNIEHLANSMVDDVFVNGKKAPRSLLTPTYKDFFYVMKKN